MSNKNKIFWKLSIGIIPAITATGIAAPLLVTSCNEKYNYEIHTSAPTIKGLNSTINVFATAGEKKYGGDVTYQLSDSLYVQIVKDVIKVVKTPTAVKDITITATDKKGDKFSPIMFAVLPDDSNYYSLSASKTYLKGAGSSLTLQAQINGKTFSGAVSYSIDSNAYASLIGNKITLNNPPSANVNLTVTATIANTTDKPTIVIPLIAKDLTEYSVVTNEPYLKGVGSTITLTTLLNGQPYTNGVTYVLDDTTYASVSGNVITLDKSPNEIKDLLITAKIDGSSDIATTKISLLPDGTTDFYNVESSSPILQGLNSTVKLTTKKDGIVYTGGVTYSLDDTTYASVSGNVITLNTVPTQIQYLTITATIDGTSSSATTEISVLPDAPTNSFSLEASSPVLEGLNSTVTLVTRKNGDVYSGSVVYTTDDTSNFVKVESNKIELIKIPSTSTTLTITGTINDAGVSKIVTTKVQLLPNQYYSLGMSKSILKGSGDQITLTTYVNGNVYTGLVTYSLSDTTNATVTGRVIDLNTPPSVAKTIVVTGTVNASTTVQASVVILPDDGQTDIKFTPPSGSEYQVRRDATVSTSALVATLQDGTAINDMRYSIFNADEWKTIINESNGGVMPTIDANTGAVSAKVTTITADYVSLHILCASTSLNLAALYIIKIKVTA